LAGTGQPLASADAVPGGEIRVFAGPVSQKPELLLDSSVLSLDVFNALYESLLDLHPLTMDFQPGLAARWRIGEDRKTFTFWLDEQARWSDGQPVTAYDVEWTVQAILDPKHLTGPHKVDLERFEAPVVVNDREIRFTAREVHWKNLLTLAGLTVLPKHVMSTQDFNKINFEFPVVSGGYRIGELKEGFLLPAWTGAPMRGGVSARAPRDWAISTASPISTIRSATMRSRRSRRARWISTPSTPRTNG
jgi:microcin C transport system substrate-binding protein